MSDDDEMYEQGVEEALLSMLDGLWVVTPWRRLIIRVLRDFVRRRGPQVTGPGDSK